MVAVRARRRLAISFLCLPILVKDVENIYIEVSRQRSVLA